MTVAVAVEAVAVAIKSRGTLSNIGAPDVDIVHHFSGGVYAKETRIPAGRSLMQHKHVYPHLSFLMSGWVLLNVDGENSEIKGPAILEIKAGSAHQVTALTDVVWACVHATDETDPEKVDSGLIA